MKHLLVLFILLFTCLSFSQTENEGTRKSPNFKLESMDRDVVELYTEIGDGPILLSFWATWCKPCLEELGEYKEIYKEFKDKGFKMFAISTDNEKTVSKVKPFVKSKNYNFPVLFDTNSEAARLFYAQAMPFTVIINKAGYIIYSHLGYMKGDEINVHDIIEKNLE